MAIEATRRAEAVRTLSVVSSISILITLAPCAQALVGQYYKRLYSKIKQLLVMAGALQACATICAVRGP